MKAVIKCFVHYEPNPYHLEGQQTFTVYPFDMADHGQVLLSTVNVEFDIPDDFNPKQAEIAGLEKQLNAMAEKYHMGTAAIRERISKLQCIENSPAVA